jgi:hypothetical protein
VDDRGRLDHDLDAFVPESEEKVRLDHLEALVCQRGRIDRDLGAHAPRRMSERIVRCYVGELGAVAAAERPAGGGEDDRVHGLEVAAFQALEDGGMLAVYREQAASTPLPGGHGELAGRDEALLVGQREVDTALERPQRGSDTREAHNRVEHDVRPRLLQELDRVSADLRQRSDAVERLRGRRGGDEVEPGVARDHLAGLASDRAGGPEHSDAFHPESV